MIERPRRPAPRTLSATPPPLSRTPHASGYQARFPSLVTVIAGGVLVPACHDPVCGTTRADELQAHGERSVEAARELKPAEALREVGVATGVLRHAETSVPRVMAPGQMMPVTATRPPVQVSEPVQEPVMTTGGAVPVVQPTPRQVPQGGMRRVNPTPPTPHHDVAPHPSTGPRPAVPGGLGMVSPMPSLRRA